MKALWGWVAFVLAVQTVLVLVIASTGLQALERSLP